MIRPYGPLAYVRIDPELGCVVQFWTEDDAKIAADALKIAFSGTFKHTLQAYDPCTICCRVSPVLAEISHYGNGKSKGQGIISFSIAEQAPSEVIEEVITSQPSSPHDSPPLAPHTAKDRVTPPLSPMANLPSSSSTTLEGQQLIIDALLAKITSMKEESMQQKALFEAQADKESLHRIECVELRTQLQAAEKERDLLDDRLACSERDNRGKRAAWEVLKACYKLQVTNATVRLATIEKEKLDLAAKLKQVELNLDEWQHKFQLADSRRRIIEMELEVDRQFWEAAKRAREAKQKEEADVARRTAEVKEAGRRLKEMVEEEKRRKAEALKQEERKQMLQRAAKQAREKAKKEQAEARQREEEAQRRRELEEEHAKEKARQKAWKAATAMERERCRVRDGLLCNPGGRPWDATAAVSRFIVIIDEFEKTKFCEARPLTFSSIPWPILDNPLGSSFGPDILTWERVEMFFVHVKAQSSSIDAYNKLVRRVHQIFHPDKWRSRALMASVYDIGLRCATESAGNKVAQAMTPIWQKTRSST
ncbi:hypothetical protein H0H87_003605 [Tephrocybe sp. NHM501043]|nr:hypothetical protein H0H87_003605 [Tephrocybe sp. NHM501043]